VDLDSPFGNPIEVLEQQFSHGTGAAELGDRANHGAQYDTGYESPEKDANITHAECGGQERNQSTTRLTEVIIAAL
jgi:hypothetical protein